MSQVIDMHKSSHIHPTPAPAKWTLRYILFSPKQGVAVNLCKNSTVHSVINHQTQVGDCSKDRVTFTECEKKMFLLNICITHQQFSSIFMGKPVFPSKSIEVWIINHCNNEGKFQSETLSFLCHL